MGKILENARKMEVLQQKVSRVMESKNICPICLRTNRKLKQIPTVLSQYHNEVTDYTLLPKDLHYCSDCEWLLRKTYNFLEKCSDAAKILNDWINATAMDKTPANQLYLKLPPISLGLWISENNRVFDYIGADKPIIQEKPIILNNFLSDKPATEQFMNLLPKKLNRNITNDEIHSNNIGNVKLLNKELDHVSTQSPLDNFLAPSAFGSLINVSHPLPLGRCLSTEEGELDYELTPVSGLSCRNSENTEESNERCTDNTEDKNLELKYFRNNDTEHPDYAILHSNDIHNDCVNPAPVKLEMERQTLDEVANISLSDKDLDDDYNFNITTNNSVEEDKLTSTEGNLIYLDHDYNVNKITNNSVEEYNFTSSARNIIFLDDDYNINKTTNNSLEEDNLTATENKSTYLDDDYNVNKTANNSDDRDNLTVERDNLTSPERNIIFLDDDNSVNKTTKNSVKENNFPSSARNIIYLDDDYNVNKTTNNSLEEDNLTATESNSSYLDDDCNVNKTANNSVEGDNLKSTERNIISMIENVDKTLDSICDNWDVTSLMPDIRFTVDEINDKLQKEMYKFLNERKNVQAKRYINMKCVINKLKLLSTDLDFINEQSANINPTDRLKEMLNEWGELRTNSGSVFDKNVIINCLDKAPERYIKKLLRLLHGKKRKQMCQAAARILTWIQRSPNHQNTKYESVFDIEYLSTKKDKLEEFQRRKTYECYLKAKFKCEICYQRFKCKKHLEYHTKKSHDVSQGQLMCHICHVIVLEDRSSVRNHRNSHEVVYKCKLCPLVTYHRDTMINHYDQHNGEIYKCAKCTKSYKSKSMYLTHLSRAHPSSDSVCTTCGNAFVSRHGLNNHMNLKHRGEKPFSAAGSESGFPCNECTLTFRTENARLRHETVAHSRTHKTLKQNCKLAVSRKRESKLPRKYSPRTRKILMICPECKAVGHGYGWMVKHFKVEHPSLDVRSYYGHKRKYLCDICGKGFPFKTLLRDHIGIHSGIKFPCPTCNKQLRTHNALKLHQKWHSPPGYCCERCGKQFHTNSSFYTHMRIHIGDRSFKCHICGKGFLCSGSVTAHIRGVHNQERRVRKSGVTRARGVTDI